MTTLQKDPQKAARAETSGRRAAALRPHVIAAVFRRNFLGYFSNPAGYVFITLFVLVSSWVAFWQPVFFANNLANLDPLNATMPYLLLFFIPAITMSAWAEERRQGTDELLLTLPARDVEVVLGKYLAALGIFTVALAFSLSHVAILAWLGSPDLGIMASTYLGYWLMGAMLIAVGLVASMLSTNVTVAFILGALFCAVPVFADLIGSTTGSGLRRQIEELSVPAQFRDFGAGVVPLAGLLYFVSLAGAMLYLNMVLLGRRHWAGGAGSRSRWAHAATRVVAVVVGLAAFNVLVARLGLTADFSQERLNTLTAESIAAIRQIPNDRPVYIQAYYSPEVPREFVQTKQDLINLLKQFQRRGGSRVRLNLVETELYSDAAREAQKQFGIEPRRVVTADAARQESSEIILGVAFTSGLEQVVIPFFDRGLPVEYELTRSIRVASRSARKKVGVLATDAKLLGGFDFRSMGQNPEWSVVTELKKQYDVSSVAADAPIPDDLDVLLVAQPSSLTQPQIDNLTAHIKKGEPTLLLVDPLPVIDPQIAPELPRQPPGGMFGGSPPPEPKGDLGPLMELIGLEWPASQIVWNRYNPHPQLGDLEPEIVFVGRGDAGEEAFNKDEPISSGLQEIVLMFPGLLRPRAGGPTFTPLLRTGDSGGTIAFRDTIRDGMFGGIGGLNPNRRYRPTGAPYVLAARIQGTPAKAATPAEPKADEAKKDEAKAEEAKPIHVVAIADLDLISDQFFELRRRKLENLEFDNVTFVLNCVDALAGDDDFVTLRKRRPRHRTLERLESQTLAFVEQSQAESKEAEEKAQDQLTQAQARLDQKVAALQANRELDERTREILTSEVREVEQRRLDVEKAGINDAERRRKLEIKAETEQKVQAIQNRVRSLAVMLPPLPPLILGLLVFGARLRKENEGASPNRLA